MFFVCFVFKLFSFHPSGRKEGREEGREEGRKEGRKGSSHFCIKENLTLKEK